MGKLTDILAAGGQSGDDFKANWNATDAAGEFAPLPPGWYVCRAESGELDASQKGTPGYKLTFRVLDGDFTGRKLWHDLWLTPAALPMSKRDLAKLGIDEPAKLEQPFPPGIRCRVQIALRRDDDGTERNEVKRFEVIGIDPPEPDAFAPPADSGPNDGKGNGGDATPQADGNDASVRPKQQDLGLQGEGNVPF